MRKNIKRYYNETTNAFSYIVTFFKLSNIAWAQFGNLNQVMQQQQRQLQQLMNQNNRTQNYVNSNVQQKANPNTIPADFFTFTKLDLDLNAKDESGRGLLKCTFSIRVKDPRYNPLVPVLTIESPQGTVHTDTNGNPLKHQNNAVNTITVPGECSGWMGFYSEFLNPLPGTNTYYACIRVYNGRTGNLVAQSRYVPFTMTGTEQKLQQQSATINKQDRTDEETNKEEQQIVGKQQNLLKEYVATNQKVNIKSGTRITMRALEELTVADANEGDLIDFQVTDDVIVNDVIAIPSGSVGKAEILKVDHGEDLLSSTESMLITPIFILLPNNEQILLNKKKLTIKGASAGPMGQGNRGKIKKGYGINCEVASNTVVTSYMLIKGDEVSETTTKKKSANNTDINSPIIGNSDIDTDIPITNSISENTFAVIIANENYDSESQVDFAINDGRLFKEYCRKTLGLPDLNIHYSENATKNNIIKEIDWLSKVAEAFGSDAKLIIYYAGHGIPDEKTNSAYLLPVDGIGANVKTGYSIDALYDQLSSLPANTITIFMDACFSGTKRGEGMLANARGVAIKAKPSVVKGKLIVFTAAQGDETAYPYIEKGHGLFTYFLLKKIQETKGNCSLLELSDYIKTQVSRRSIIVNRKSQTPTVKASPILGNTWQDIRL